MIQQMVRCSDYLRVKPLFERFFGDTPNGHQSALHDFRSIPSVLRHHLPVIIHLVSRYFEIDNESNPNYPTTMTMTGSQWMSLCETFHFTTNPAIKTLMEMLFRQISNENIIIITCYALHHIAPLQSIQSAQTAPNPKLSDLKMDLRHLVPILLFTADIVCVDINGVSKTSDKLHILFQRHLVPVIHPKADIIALSHMDSTKRLVNGMYRNTLCSVWSKCLLHDGATAQYQGNRYYDFYGLIRPTLLVDILVPHCTLSTTDLLSKCTECSISGLGKAMDFEAFYGIICWVGQRTKCTASWHSVEQRISAFLQKL